MSVSVTPIVNGALRSFSNRLIVGQEDIIGQVENIQTKALLRSNRKLRRVLKT